MIPSARGCRDAVGLPPGMRDLVARASAAASFRSLCGSGRRVPKCSFAAFVNAAPQVGQRTDMTGFGVSSRLFTRP